VPDLGQMRPCGCATYVLRPLTWAPKEVDPYTLFIISPPVLKCLKICYQIIAFCSYRRIQYSECNFRAKLFPFKFTSDFGTVLLPLCFCVLQHVPDLGQMRPCGCATYVLRPLTWAPKEVDPVGLHSHRHMRPSILSLRLESLGWISTPSNLKLHHINRIFGGTHRRIDVVFLFFFFSHPISRLLKKNVYFY
jgi:hypothetical protein